MIYLLGFLVMVLYKPSTLKIPGINKPFYVCHKLYINLCYSFLLTVFCNNTQ
jgi:hypothetical protein